MGKVCLNILMPSLALTLLGIVVTVTVANRSFFDTLPIHLSSLAVVFLCRPGGFLALHDQFSSSFLKILWITLLDFSTVFEISPIAGLSSLRNLTISFLSSNDVRYFSPCLQCKSRCNLAKYPILYSYPKNSLIIQNNYWIVRIYLIVLMFLIIYIFRFLYDYSYNFISMKL